MINSDRNSWLICSSQLIGIFLGGLVGFIIYAFLPDDPQFVQEMGARFYAFLFSVTGWLFSLILQGKCIFCGGIDEITDDRKGRYYIFFISLIACLAILPLLLLMTKNYAMFYGVFFILILVILGEVGQDDPFSIIKGVWTHVS